MSVSFIITTYNIEPYIRQCLESLRPCTRPGDQVILVDDGSTDGTADVIETFLMEGGFGQDVIWTPIWLGTNTFGGVGIPGNIGLDHAICDTVFYVDGDDYLIPDAFLRARSEYEARPADICFTNYLEYDEKARQTKQPADHAKWRALGLPMDAEARRMAAIGLIAVPWRKFYRRSFLTRHKIRFPEGDFFFEDNPFHWRVCLAAETISFSNRVVCHHRVNRPGQTMASTGAELAAFFAHFRTIIADLPSGRDALYLQAIRWLLGNMSWHLPRLHASAFGAYAMQASDTLRLIDEESWQRLMPELCHSATWQYAQRLRQGHVWDVLVEWRREVDRRNLRDLDKRVRDIGNQISKLDAQVKTVREVTQARKYIDEFDALQRLRGS